MAPIRLNKQALMTIALTVLVVLWSLHGNAPAQTRQKPSDEADADSTRSGSISGRVVADGQPIPNASVFVRRLNSATAPRAVPTENDGSFRVKNLEPGVFSVLASAPSYVAPPSDSDGGPYYKLGDSVTIDLIKGGVITGKVVNSAGDPVVAIRVRATMIRDADGQPPRFGQQSQEQMTDDRGIYRLFGLQPGTYVVSSGGRGFASYGLNAYDADAPTYAPSSTRDTAVEIVVRGGEESTDVDISYRGDAGHAISGNVVGLTGPDSPWINITLARVTGGTSEASASAYQGGGTKAFAFYGVRDGEYDLWAQVSQGPGESAVSEPRRIRIKGADVGGLELIVKPLAEISGQVVLENSTALECKGKRKPLFTEILIATQRNEKRPVKEQWRLPFNSVSQASPGKAGEFLLRSLGPGEYGLSPRFFARYWYLRSITMQSAAPAGKAALANQPADATRNWITLKLGERVVGLKVTLAEGAASLRGNIKLAEGERVPAKLYLHLVPAEKEKADDVLRFFATTVNDDGIFALGNLPPGRYFALTRVAADNESQWASNLRLPEEADTRAKLRREAEAAKTEIEFKPCQNLTDYQLPLKPP